MIKTHTKNFVIEKMFPLVPNKSYRKKKIKPKQHINFPNKKPKKISPFHILIQMESLFSSGT